ncbi:MAG: DUF1553 domain-containing protein [Planctomycetota bacterium]|nr:MAG: DUF1553 domain-containing protein [Planctomycetota bacterium]
MVGSFQNIASIACWILLLTATFLGGQAVAQTDTRGQTAADGDIDFARDIQPIFSRACTKCHGGVKQSADLSFIDFRRVVAPQGYAVEPGSLEDSLVWDRITAEDPEDRMPPPEEGIPPLTAGEMDLIRRWILAGAPIEDHWSRRPLHPPTLPEDSAADLWSRDPLDRIVWMDLQAAGLTPRPDAPPAQWLRRVYFDLIGLPPTPQEIEQFVSAVARADRPAEVEREYAAVVDALLASEHFGERWAAMWLDLARYADSKGFEKDPHRDIWPYRDWLIRAFNRDMPYDQFTVEQLAGDLLPDPTYDQLVATAFHRNTQTNTEGGTDDEEFRVAAVIDRVNTTWTVWQATTFGCVQCHNHPYEPFENREYYQFLHLFNSTEDCDQPDEFPTIPYLSAPDQQTEFMQARQAMSAARDALDRADHAALEPLAWQPMKIHRVASTSGQLAAVDGEIRVVGGTVAVGSTYTVDLSAERVGAVRLQILPVSDDPAHWPEQGAVISQLQAAVIGPDDASTPVPIAAVIADYRTGPYEPEDALADNAAGFGGYPKLFRPRWVVFVFDQVLDLPQGNRLRLEIAQKASVAGGLANNLRRFTVEANADPALVHAVASPARKALWGEYQRAKKALARFRGPALPIMQQRTAEAARETRTFVRGNFLERDEVVEPGIPAAFARPDGSIPPVRNRLELARWLCSQDNPLAARVWVNRIWNELFGIGIVETVEDFGPSGLPPTHPELLEHLAHAMSHDLGWSLKGFLRRVVLSSTYRQDARAAPELYQRDPDNRLLARGPRNRLSAEMIRDQGLLASGLLTRKVGGPSVMPPQPEGVWLQVYSSDQWREEQGEDRYRRGVYTYWKRTSPYPEFITFDAPTRDVCSPRRIVTNTPLQALVTLNSRTYTEFARALAEQARATWGDDLPAAVEEIFLRVTSRRPTDPERRVLLRLYDALQRNNTTRSAAANVPTVADTATGDTATDFEVAAAENATENLEQAAGQEGGDGLMLDALGRLALTILNTEWALTR